MSNFERITAIDRALRGGGVTAAEIARRYEVDHRTVKRDIEYLRDRLNAPIEWNPASKQYEYTREFTDLLTGCRNGASPYARSGKAGEGNSCKRWCGERENTVR